MLSVFVLQVLRQTFPQHTFLMNGLIHGVKVSMTHAFFYCSFCCVVVVVFIGQYDRSDNKICLAVV